jgi:outer membrane protein OmpA-like peptidoglycan-associated protein
VLYVVLLHLFLILPFGVGGSFRKRHDKPEATIISNEGERNFPYLQKPSWAIRCDSLQTAHSYTKADIVASVFFDFEKSNIEEKWAAKIGEAARFFLDHSELKILVVGHCDHFERCRLQNGRSS